MASGLSPLWDLRNSATRPAPELDQIAAQFIGRPIRQGCF
jgi:hypothetical protein